MSDQAPLKPLHFSILLVLADGEDYGYGIVKRISASDAGAISIAPSNLYNVLDQLIEMDLIETSPRKDTDAPRRAYFRITKRGLRAARAEADRLAAMVDRTERLRALKGGAR